MPATRSIQVTYIWFCVALLDFFFFFFCFKPLTDIMSVVSDVFTGLMDVPLLSSVLAC